MNNPGHTPSGSEPGAQETPHAGSFGELTVSDTGLRRASFSAVDETFVREGLSALHRCFDSLAALFGSYDDTAIHCAGRFEHETSDGRNYCMPAQIGQYSILKWIRSRPENVDRGLERSQSQVLISNERTGELLCVVPGALLTPTKTALVNMLALKAWIDREEIDSVQLGIIGGGPVSRKSVEAARAIVGDILDEVILVYSPRNSGKKLAADLAASHGTKFAPKEQILASCNVIISSTTSVEPVIRGQDLVQNSGQPRLFVGVGYRDFGPCVFDSADLIVSEDPISYRQRADFPLGSWLANDPDRTLGSLHSFLNAAYPEQDRSPGSGVTMFMPYGTAMADGALCLSVLNFPIDLPEPGSSS